MQHRDAPWWTDATVYQIYPRSFADGNGDGVGDLAGIRQRLGHLADLGVDVIWLSPIYRSPQADNGYDISDYDDIDPLFGTLDEFDALMGEVHALGMKLVMDLVVNHTSDEHAWFEQARSSRDDPKRDWYIWRDPLPVGPDGRGEGTDAAGTPGAGTFPTAWRSAFSGPAWTLDEATGQYYLHMFASKQPDLNWENPALRQAVYDMMNRWLDRGVDGFRMDVINHIAKDPASLEPGARGFVMGGRIHDHLREMHRYVFASRTDRELITVGEMPGVTVDDAALFTAQDRHELDMVFQFEHVGLDHGPSSKFDNRPFDLVALKRSLGRWQDGLADAGWNSLYLGNHDQPRSLSRFGDDGAHRYESATMLAAVLHLHRGTPYVYQGDEIGMTNAGFTSIEQYRDIESINWYAEEVEAGADPEVLLESLRFRSRDNARTPVQWSGGDAAGFSTGTPWIEVVANHHAVNVEADRASSDRSVFDWYRRLIALRHESPVVAHGRFEMLAPDDDRLYAFTRTLGDEQLLVLANWSGEPYELDPALHPVLRRRSVPEVVLGNVPHGIGSLTLAPWEVRVLRA
ncbi:oligo-1,6-glucosidase [Frigoribacterium faeni]|uniref:Oligo-1,6-glucosidase n=1 Tax=Frigoribacterium faeni TaxID=145483 RepID=A0ABQ0UQF0_9MICO|nr:oligo-1,6-glucosidase [Microbacterium flavescens]GEK83699.1 oligo-1,6-glucosidase [Frigoribacterium faeni]